MRIVLGVSGGVAAYKSAELARALIRNGHEVTAVLTRGACEFIRPLTFAALTGRKVITDLFAAETPESTLSSSVEHIAVAREHDLLLIAPATANVLARFAHGMADDFLTTLYLAFRGPVVIAPAMNDQMWDHPATRSNVSILQERGHIFAGPGAGYLACGTYGEGRLVENEVVLEAVAGAFQSGKDLKAETILITAGPTQEPIDPVRFLSNRSSGKMGYALVSEALDRGARVILVTGPVNLPPPPGAEVVHVRTAQEMYDAVFAHLEPATAIVKCAAVADYRPAHPSPQKLKKSNSPLALDLAPTADILAELGRQKQRRLLIGFAAETENVETHALRKMESKNCDMIVANDVSDLETGFESDQNQVILFFRDAPPIKVPRGPKRTIARTILDQIGRWR